MTVGVLTTSFPRHAGDFAGTFVADNVRALAAQGTTVEVIAADDGAGPAEAVPRPDLGPRVRVWRVPMNAGGGTRLFYGDGAPEALERGGARVWAQAAAFWAGLCGRLRARAGSWDRVEAHWLVPCGLAAHACFPDLPLALHAHSGDVALLERLPLGPTLARYLARGARDIVFASEDLRLRFGRLAGACVGRVMQRHGSLEAVIDPARRLEARRMLRFDGHTLLSVGRLVPIKGFDVLVRAAALAGRGSGAPTVVILGDGPERARLASLAQRLEVPLRLPGFVHRQEVARWMTAADLYVQPSRRLASGRTEGLPVATLEALSLGLRVVASATGGLSELPHAAPRLRLVPADDPAALAALLAA
jgi:glycosyltransferase involved in cell wall biosynthesis